MIIGRSLSSLLYCWKTQTRCIIHEPIQPHRFDKEYCGYDFSFANANDSKELWVNLCFTMALSSLLLFPGNVESIREEDDGIAVITKGSRIKRLKTDSLTYFDEKIADSFDVYDFFDTKLMRRHDRNELLDSDDFVSQINFYKSRRDSVSTKDLVASSRMTREQLLDPSYGNGIAKIKVLRMLKSEGITGPLSVRTEKKTYYKNPKIEFFERVVSERSKPLHTFKEVFNMKQTEGEEWKMIQKLKARQTTSSE